MPFIECLTPECRERATHKGLCMKCYSEAKKLVETKTFTWMELSRMGLANLGVSKFQAALDKKRKENS